jgi:hypothetical protein
VANALREQGIEVGRPLDVCDLVGMVDVAVDLLGVVETSQPGA